MKTARLFVYALLLGAMLVSACSGGAATQAPAAGGNQPAASGEKVNLVYWSMWNKTEPSAIALTDIIQKFQAKYPNVTVTAVWNGR